MNPFELVYIVGWMSCLLAAAHFGPKALRRLEDLPPRDRVLHELDILILVALYFGARYAVQVIAPPLIAPVEGEPDFAAKIAAITWLDQLCSGAAVIAYIAFRAKRVDGGLREVGLMPTAPGREIGHGLIAAVVSLFAVMGTIIVAIYVGERFDLNAPPSADHGALRMAQSSPGLGVRLALGISAVVFAPLFEEIFYRAVVQTGLVKLFGPRLRVLAILIAGVVFGLVHLSSSGWQSVAGLCVFGWILGYLYERYNSVLPCVIVHGFFNLYNYSLALLPTQ